MSAFRIYKPRQGKHTRVWTFVGAVLIAVCGAYVLSGQLYFFGAYLRYGIPALLVALVALLTFWMVNRAKGADFLIATEGEMKKVSWSSRKEVVGSTKVVIITTLIIAVILFAVDILFRIVFIRLGVVS